MAEPKSRAEQLGEQGASYLDGLVKEGARLLGGRSSTAQNISHEREVELWRMPTSPAAEEARKLGGSAEDIEQANRLWVAHQINQRRAMTDGGATAEQIKEAGLTDQQIAQVARKHAYEMGKQHGHDDPEQEYRYHAKMRERVARTYRTVEPEEGAI